MNMKEAQAAFDAAEKVFVEAKDAYAIASQKLADARSALYALKEQARAERAERELAAMDQCKIVSGYREDIKTVAVIVRQTPTGILSVQIPGSELAYQFQYTGFYWRERGGSKWHKKSLADVPQKYTDAAIAAKAKK